MDWRAEAIAIINDISKFVHKIEVSHRLESNDMRIYFDIETKERAKLIVSMDSIGFRICDKDELRQKTNEASQVDGDALEKATRAVIDHTKVYETINALLDDNSPMYRDAFAHALMDKISSVE